MLAQSEVTTAQIFGDMLHVRRSVDPKFSTGHLTDQNFENGLTYFSGHGFVRFQPFMNFGEHSKSRVQYRPYCDELSDPIHLRFLRTELVEKLRLLLPITSVNTGRLSRLVCELWPDPTCCNNLDDRCFPTFYWYSRRSWLVPGTTKHDSTQNVNSIQTVLEIGRSLGEICSRCEISASCFTSFELLLEKHWMWTKLSVNSTVPLSTIVSDVLYARPSSLKHSSVGLDRQLLD